MQHLLKLFPPSFDFITAATAVKPEWTTHARYRLTPAELVRTWADPQTLIGIRPGTETQFLLLDIDRHSIYHPYNNPELWDALLYHLEQIGLIDALVIRSSDSGGIHLYYVFSEPVNAFQLACLVRTHFTQGGFDFRAGQIESIPNTKAFDSNFQPFRLPFQTGSVLLDIHGDELISPHNLTPQTRMSYLVSQIENNRNDLKLLKSKLAGATKAYKQSLYARYGTGAGAAKIVAWERDWRETIELGWTGAGQTNDLVKIMVNYTIVFEGITDRAILFERAKAKVINAPGYRELCHHQHQIDDRIYHWIDCTLKSKFYTPLIGHPARIGKYPGNSSSYRPKRPTSTVRTDGVIQRIHDAIAWVKRSLGALPQKITERMNAIVAASKEIGHGISKNTLYRSCYKAIWQTAQTAETRQTDQTEIQSEFPPISKSENIEENPSQSQSEYPISPIFTLMKRSPDNGYDATDRGADLEPSIDLQGQDDRSNLSNTESEPAIDLFSSSTQIDRSTIHIQNTSTPSPILNSPSTLNSQLLTPNSPTDESSEEPISLPALGAFVMRRSQVYRGKSYPELFARVIRAVGMGWEVITDTGDRYRFDPIDWLETWFPLLE